MYQDGSNNIGTLVEDEFSFTSDKDNAFKAYFGCKKYEKDATKLVVNGLIGLSPDPSFNVLYSWFTKKVGR